MERRGACVRCLPPPYQVVVERPIEVEVIKYVDRVVETEVEVEKVVEVERVVRVEARRIVHYIVQYVVHYVVHCIEHDIVHYIELCIVYYIARYTRGGIYLCFVLTTLLLPYPGARRDAA